MGISVNDYVNNDHVNIDSVVVTDRKVIISITDLIDATKCDVVYDFESKSTYKTNLRC